MTSRTLFLALLIVAPAAFAATPKPAAGLRAGASRIDVTPAPDKLPASFRGVLDPIYVRTVVVDNGSSRAALVAVDAGGISTDLYAKVSARAARELQIPSAQLLISATHTHSVPFGPNAGLEDKIVQGLREAIARLEPARVSWGTGESHINVNRDRIDPKTHRWWEGPNTDGDSDKTVAVIRFESTSGKPIAVYTNYAVHAVITGTLDLVSGDIPGATSRYLEESSAVTRSRCGPAAPPATRTRCISTRPTSCATSASPTTRSAAKTSATRCRPAARAWTATIRACSC